MFQRILCPIDGSDHSEKALTLAGDLAERYATELTLLHVQGHGSSAAEGLEQFARNEGLVRREADPKMPSGLGAAELMGSAAIIEQDAAGKGASESRLAEILLEQACQRVPGGIAVKTALAHGAPADAILETAKTEDVDLIVMGSRGLGRVKTLVLGSVSSKVANEAPCTCITVK